MREKRPDLKVLYLPQPEGEYEAGYNFEMAVRNAIAHGYTQEQLEYKLGVVIWGNQREECAAIKKRMRRGK